MSGPVGTDRVRSLTLIPPWSTAIAAGHKHTENRPRNVAGRWRGRVLLLSSAGRWDATGAQIVAALTGTPALTRAQCHPAHYVGAADLVDAHESTGRCCTPWGEPGGWHLGFANATQFERPIPATGHLGLRRVTDPALLHAATASSIRRTR